LRHDQPRFKGLTTAEGQIDAFGTRIINLGAPVADTDAARLQDISSSQFYNTVKQTDGLASFSGIKVWNYNAEHFYINQNAPNTDEFILNLRNPGNEITIEDTVPNQRFKNDTIIVNRNDFYLTADSTGKPILNSTFSDSEAVTALPTGYISGARSRFVSTSEVSVGTTGQLTRVRSSDDNFNIDWFGLVNADITVSGAGGLDTGSPTASTFLGIYAIADSTGVNAVTALLSLNFTTPLLPAGYDQFRRVGSVRLGGAVPPFDEFLDFEQRGNGRDKRIFYRVTSLQPLLLFNGSATSLTSLNAGTLIPVGASMMQVRVDIDAQTVESAFGLLSQLNDSPGDLHIDFDPNTTSTDKRAYGVSWIAVEDDLQILYRVDTSSTLMDVRVMGFLETL
jgi:hypothetical protein